MTKEIIEAVSQIEKEKGIEAETLIEALEDALLAAYKKTPGAARHATVELDSGGDFRVWSVELPADVEERLMDEARERAITDRSGGAAPNQSFAWRGSSVVFIVSPTFSVANSRFFLIWSSFRPMSCRRL